MEHLTDEQKAAYAELISLGKTINAESDVAKHISECDKCAGECVELSYIVDDLENKASTKKTSTIGAMIFTVAAVLLIPVVAWIGILSFNSSDIDSELVACYVEDVQNEQIVAEFQGSFRSEKVTINTPSIIEVQVGENAVLTWSSSQKLILDVVDNINEEVSSNSVDDNLFIFVPDAKGLYYWKLYNNDFDLLFCGKIIVK